MTEEIALEVINLSRAAKEKQTDLIIIEDISYRFFSEKIYAIIGLSGSGKTSFLRLLNNLDSPTNGEIKLKGLSLNNIDSKQIRRKIGFLFQDTFLFEKTIRDNILYANSQMTEDEILSVLNQVNLPLNFMDKEVSRLSGGESHRVAFGRLLAMDPDIYLLDEPTAALDPKLTETIEKLIINLAAERKKTVIIVTHDPRQALRLKCETLIMHEGKIAASGPAETIVDNDLLTKINYLPEKQTK